MVDGEGWPELWIEGEKVRWEAEAEQELAFVNRPQAALGAWTRSGGQVELEGGCRAWCCRWRARDFVRPQWKDGSYRIAAATKECGGRQAPSTKAAAMHKRRLLHERRRARQTGEHDNPQARLFLAGAQSFYSTPSGFCPCCPR